MTQAELVAAHTGDLVGFKFTGDVGYAVVRRSARPAQWVGGGRMVEVALYVRRDRGRPAADFGPAALTRVVPLDKWQRASPEEELRYFQLEPEYCWTGGFIRRVAVEVAS